MKTTVTEAMRLKKEVSEIVCSLNDNAYRSINMGNVYIDGVISSEGYGYSYSLVYEVLNRALNVNEEINHVLANFNRENGVDSFVRAMMNNRLNVKMLERLLPLTKPSCKNTWVEIQNKRKTVVEEYQPTVTTTEIKEKLSMHKKQMRELQVKIEKLNQKEIEFSFSYEDVEKLRLD